jgi:hypothetical protein
MMRRILVDQPVRRALATVLFLFTMAVVAPSAAANIPEPVTRIDPLRVPWAGDTTNGTVITRVTYSDTSATAAALTGDTIALGKGFVFRLFTCVAYHLYGMTPVSNCSERSVDTRANTDTVQTHAPSVTLSDQPRPTAQPWGYFTVVTEVRDASSLMVLARSWPDNGLQGAGFAVAAQGQDGGTLPPNVVTLDGPFTTRSTAASPTASAAINRCRRMVPRCPPE